MASHAVDSLCAMFAKEATRLGCLRGEAWRARVHSVGRSSPRKLSVLLPPSQRVPLAFVGQTVTNRIANAPHVLDLGLERPALLACSNFIVL